MEVARRAGSLQIHLDHIARAGAGDDARHGHIFQRGEQFFQARFAGHALGEADVGQLPDLVQHLLRVTRDVLGHMAAQVIARQAAAARLELGHIRGQGQAQFLAGRLPQGIPQTLGVKHQAVHIKNDCFYHGKPLYRHICGRIHPYDHR